MDYPDTSCLCSCWSYCSSFQHLLIISPCWILICILVQCKHQSDQSNHHFFFIKHTFFFLPLFLFRCSINITACCFHITHFPRQLVNKYDLHISDGVSHCMVQQRTVLSEQNQASSAVCPPTLSRESNVEARISKSFPCSPIKTSLHDNDPNTHNH